MSKNNSNGTGFTSSEQHKKPESRYDAGRLRHLIKCGMSAREIMKEMDIGHKQILKHHVLKLCATDKTFYEVPGLYDKNTAKAFVNSKGEIRLRMKLIDFSYMPLSPDTEFDVTVEGNRIILTNLSMESSVPVTSLDEALMGNEGEL